MHINVLESWLTTVHTPEFKHGLDEHEDDAVVISIEDWNKVYHVIGGD